jgi:DNA primase
MNCTEAKKIPITYYLHTIGITPKDVKNGSAWYCSPFRQETKPSFKVDRQNNIWYDFGTGSGGNILDLVMNLNKTGIPGALLILQKPELSKPDLSFSEQQSSNPANIKIKHLQPLQNRALIEYLNSRKITPAKAANYVQEAYYTVNEKQYFALAFKNDRGGFELRNKYFKGSSSPKAVTTISGHKQAVNIFEGFIDFLSALEHYHTTKPTGTCIVLNSVSNLETIINSLEQYQQINLYLDNDNAGNQAAETIKTIHQKVKNFSKIIYEDYKDMNEFLTAGYRHKIK